MTTRSLRAVALGVAVVVAVLTGLFTGFVGASSDCDSAKRDVKQTENQDDVEEQRKKNEDNANKERNKETEPQQTRKDPLLPGNGTNPSTGGEGEFGGGGNATLADDDEASCEESFSVPAAAIGFGGALLAGLVVFIVLSSRAAAAASSPTVPTPLAPSGSAYPTPVTAVAERTDSKTEQQRRALVETLIYVRDRATSSAIAERVGTALRSVGVTEISPTGVTFDPAQHEAGGFAHTDNPSANGTIAAVEAVGYTDQGTVLRPPVVTVYRTQGS